MPKPIHGTRIQIYAIYMRYYIVKMLIKINAVLSSKGFSLYRTREPGVRIPDRGSEQ